MDLENIVKQIFFSEDSPEGKEKSTHINGLGKAGRFCAPNMSVLEERKFPYRVTKADLLYFKEHPHELFNPEDKDKGIAAIQSFLAAGAKQYTYVDFLLEIMPELAKRAADFAEEKDREAFKKTITGCQLEFFLFNPDRPFISMEIIPEIEGFPADNFYGSQLRTQFPISVFSPGLEELGDMKNTAKFASLAFAEKFDDFMGSNYSKVESGTIAVYEWYDSKEIWFINHKFYILTFLLNCACELHFMQDPGATIIGLEDVLSLKKSGLAAIVGISRNKK